MSDILPVVSRLARQVYRDVAASEGIDIRYLHPSQANLCAQLTLAFWHALDDEGIEARREVHQTGRGGWLWHCVIAYGPVTDAPTPHDRIIDLNPWVFDQRSGLLSEDLMDIGYLDGSREEVTTELGNRGFGIVALLLHNVETITKPHTLEPKPVDTTGFPRY